MPTAAHENKGRSRERSTAKGHPETDGGEGSICYLDGGDGFMGTEIHQNLPKLYILNTGSLLYELASTAPSKRHKEKNQDGYMTKCFFGQDPSEITNELELAGRETRGRGLIF